MTNAEDIDAMQIQPDPDKLLAYHRQQLSAMLDGELSPDQAKFMLRRLQHDGELAACWERWQVCGDVLRGHHQALLPSDFAARVAQGIAGDAAAVQASPAQARSPRLARWGGGAALAASVALVAVFAPRMLPEAADPSPLPAQSPVLAASPATNAAISDGLAMAAAASGDETPANPSPVDVAPAVLATALAAAEAPRRSAERRTRTQEQRVASATQVRAATGAPPVVAVAANDAVAPLIDLTTPQGAFPTPETLQPRPWPRAILPGAGDTAFNVGYGHVPSLQAEDGAYDPFFRPRIDVPVILMPPADTGAEAEDVETAPPANRSATP